MIGMRRGLDSIGIIGVGQFELFGVVEGLGLWVVRVRMWWGGVCADLDGMGDIDG